MKYYYEELKLEIITFAADIITASESSPAYPWFDAEKDGDVTKIPNWW